MDLKQKRKVLLGAVATLMWPATIGLLYGFVVTFFAMVLTAGGHGWYGASPSIVAILFGPMHGIAWALKGRPIGLTIAILLLTSMIITDIVILHVIDTEGTLYLEEVWESLPGILFAWGVMWVFWQIAAIRMVHLSYKNFKKCKGRCS